MKNNKDWYSMYICVFVRVKCLYRVIMNVMQNFQVVTLMFFQNFSRNETQKFLSDIFWRRQDLYLMTSDTVQGNFTYFVYCWKLYKFWEIISFTFQEICKTFIPQALYPFILLYRFYRRFYARFLCLFSQLITGYIGQEDDYISRVKLFMFVFLEEDVTMYWYRPCRANQGSISFFPSLLSFHLCFSVTLGTMFNLSVGG